MEYDLDENEELVDEPLLIGDELFPLRFFPDPLLLPFECRLGRLRPSREEELLVLLRDDTELDLDLGEVLLDRDERDEDEDGSLFRE